MSATLAVAVEDPTAAGEARRAASDVALSVGLGAEDAGRAALVAFEAASNLVKHGGGGEVLLRPLARGAQRGVEIVVIDRGPGIADLATCFRDGFSTAGSPGTGLGAIARMAPGLDVHSTVGAGTALVARIWPGGDRKAGARPAFDVAGVAVAKPGETVCGDAWASRDDPDGLSLLVADGLGHGMQAGDAAAAAVEAFRQTRETDVCAMMERIHAALQPTRGAAAAVARIDARRGVLSFCGVGNIAAAILTADGPQRRAVSHNGIAGHAAPRISEFTYPWPADGLLVMHSDGLLTHWSVPADVLRHDPAVVAAVLYRDFSRRRDDVSVVVARTAP